MTLAANLPTAAAAAVDRRDRQTDGRTDGRQLLMLLTAYCGPRNSKPVHHVDRLIIV